MHKSTKLTLLTAVGVTAAMVIAACGSGRTDDSSSQTGDSGASNSQEAPATDSESDEGSTEGSDTEEPTSDAAAPSGATIAIGTTDKVVSLDPAGS